MRIWWMALCLVTALSGLRPTNGFAAPAAPRTLIRGGTVVDGTGARRRAADVLIIGDRIATVGKLRPHAGDRVIDARGLVVAPGFIDTHSHIDQQLLEMPDAPTAIRQGITTAIVGQDGDSQMPLSAFFARVAAKHVAPNIASFVGHGSVRSAVMGKDYKRRSTPAEVARMRALVAREMAAGALGLSSGLEYDPGFYADTAEVASLAQVAGQYGGIYISHMRNEDNRFFAAFAELQRIAREGHLPAQVSHIKLGSKRVWGKAGEVLARMARARREGLDLTADVYPYLYWQSTITALIPTRNWDDRAAWARGLADVGGPDHVRLSVYTPDPSWAGKTIAEISRATKMDPISVIQKVVHATHTNGEGEAPGERAVVTAMSEPDLRRFIAAPRIMFCTDEGLRPTHPRGAGSFPRVLGRYVREERLLTLEQAIRKMTSLPAGRMGLAGRGLIRRGYEADLVLFNPRTVRDTATVLHPAAPPIGITYVFVNGTAVLDHGHITGEHPGIILHRSRRPVPARQRPQGNQNRYGAKTE